jgi:hypothetical protein
MLTNKVHRDDIKTRSKNQHMIRADEDLDPESGANKVKMSKKLTKILAKKCILRSKRARETPINHPAATKLKSSRRKNKAVAVSTGDICSQMTPKYSRTTLPIFLNKSVLSTKRKDSDMDIII